VQFTVWWPALGPQSGPWKVACTLSTPTSGDAYGCDVDLGPLGAPSGQVLVSFDVYDQGGRTTLSPGGERAIYFSPPVFVPQEVTKSTILQDTQDQQYAPVDDQRIACALGGHGGVVQRQDQVRIGVGLRHEQTVFEPLMENGVVKRLGRGRPRLRPDRVAGDKGYSSRRIRRYLYRRGIGVVIARQTRERRVRFDRAAYRQRPLRVGRGAFGDPLGMVERLVNRLKQFRRVATRYEKRAVNYLAMLTVAAIAL
jgi:transposase